MWRRGLGEEQAHGIALVAERRLHTDEDIAELLAVDQQVQAIRVELPGGLAPVLLELAGVGSELLVLVNVHLVLDVEVGRAHAGLLVVEHRVHDALSCVGHVANVVALPLELLAHRQDGSEDIEVGGRADVALVGGEGEDGDGELLVLVLLHAQVRPLERAVREQVDAVRKGDSAPGQSVTSAVDDGLDGAVDLRQRHLQCNLDGVQAKLGGLPLLERLEDERDGAEVGAVELRERLHCFVVVLRGRATHEREPGQVDDGVWDDGTASEEVVDGPREVEPSGVEADHTSAPCLELLDQGGVVALVLGVDVRLLEDDANRRRRLGVHADRRSVLVVVPSVVLGGILEHAGGKRMPDADVREKHRLRDGVGLHLVEALVHVRVSHHEKERLKVLRGAAEPVLEREHEGARVLGLVRRKVLEHLGECAEELEHGALEGGAVLLALLLHELANHRLRLSHLRHGEAADLVQAHHVGHRGEDQHGVKLRPQRLHNLHNLLGKLLHEDEGSDEDVGGLNVAFEGFERLRVAQLLEEIADRLDTNVVLPCVDPLACNAHGGLVL
mmetsp:Transcript_38127/g.78203  ORF Transcript_38127/g.78203 Transcript_38127/m.78203 type:complete len:557 (+) Transcript_38127:2459-4129(+)